MRKSRVFSLCLFLIVAAAICAKSNSLSDAHQLYDDGRKKNSRSHTDNRIILGTQTLTSEDRKVTEIATAVEHTRIRTATLDLISNESLLNNNKNLPVSTIKFRPEELVTALAWSPDGASLAIAAGDRVYLYDSQSLMEHDILQIGAYTNSLAFSSRGDWLAAGSRDGILRVWSYEDIVESRGSGEIDPLWTLEAHKKGVNSVTFSEDGEILASGGIDAIVRLWDVKTGEERGTLIGGTFSVPGIAFDPKTSILAIVNGDYIRLRDSQTQQIWGTIRAPAPQYSIAYSPDGSLLVSSDIANRIYIWDPEAAFRTGLETYPVPVILEGHEGLAGTYRGLVWQIEFHPDGDFLASAGGDETVRLWEIASGNLLRTLNAHTAAVTSLAFSPDGSRMASGGLDGLVFIWEVDS
jgi:WD40 repeat protein